MHIERTKLEELLSLHEWGGTKSSLNGVSHAADWSMLSRTTRCLRRIKPIATASAESCKVVRLPFFKIDLTGDGEISTSSTYKLGRGTPGKRSKRYRAPHDARRWVAVHILSNDFSAPAAPRPAANPSTHRNSRDSFLLLPLLLLLLREGAEHNSDHRLSHSAVGKMRRRFEGRGREWDGIGWAGCMARNLCCFAL